MRNWSRSLPRALSHLLSGPKVPCVLLWGSHLGFTRGLMCSKQSLMRRAPGHDAKKSLGFGARRHAPLWRSLRMPVQASSPGHIPGCVRGVTRWLTRLEIAQVRRQKSAAKQMQLHTPCRNRRNA